MTHKVIPVVKLVYSLHQEVHRYTNGLYKLNFNFKKKRLHINVGLVPIGFKYKLVISI
jgi:hypothetical protein